MRLYWNFNGDIITTSLLGALQQLSKPVALKAGQNQPIELQFHRDRVPELLPIGTAILLGVKKAGEFDGAYLTTADAWTRPDIDAGFYTAGLSTNTDAIRAALSADVAALVGLLVELQYLLPGEELPSKAPTFNFRIDACVIQGDESAPDEADPPYPPLAELVRLLPAVTGYVGGGATKLDGIATVGQALDVVSFVHPIDGLQTYRLVAGTAAESSPGIVRPDDFNADSNARVWKLVSREAPVEEAARDEFIRFLPAVTGYVGGGASKLDGLATVDQTNLLAIAFRHVTDGLQTYRLVAGTDAESVPAVIRPNDFDADDNAFIWQLLTSQPLLTDALSDGQAYGRKSGAWVRVVLA